MLTSSRRNAESSYDIILAQFVVDGDDDHDHAKSQPFNHCGRLVAVADPRKR
jgi:hypothetical protein